MEPQVMIVITIVGAIVLGVMIYLAMEPCPSCGRRGTVRWQHQRKRGGPDRRYSNNHQFCTACNWTTAPPPPDPRVIEREFQEQRERERQRRLELEQQREKERQAIAAAEEKERRRVEEEATERTIVWLLKYIAKADRRNAEGEQQFLVEQIHALFPPERHARIERWADALKVDSAADYDAMVGRLRGLPLERRQGIYGSLSAMAEADGKATKAELTRLAKLRQELGLEETR